MPDYYVSPDGDDGRDGTAPGRAWRTLDRVGRAAFAPGSRVLFEGGRVFRGTLRLDERSAGRAEAPVVVGSYGAGRAVLDAGDGYGVLVRNTGGVCVEHLRVRGSGPGRNRGSGVAFEHDRPGDRRLAHLRVRHVDVSGFGYHGVVVDGKHGKSGFRDVEVAYAEAHGNALSGVTVQGRWDGRAAGYAHADVRVRHTAAHHNPGVPGPDRPHSGSGIVLSDVDGGLVEHCAAYANGGASDSAGGGPVGIWAWDARRLLIQYNVSCRNRTAGPHDGGGFDLDGGVSDSVVRCNVAYENDGAGYLLTHFACGRPHARNTVRRNVSYHDGRRNNAGGIKIAGAVADVRVAHNSVFVGPAAEGAPSAVGVYETRLRSADLVEVGVGTRVCHNLFQASGGAWLVRVYGEHPGLRLAENVYVACDGPVRADWQGTECRTLAEWRARAGQDGARAGAADAPPGATGDADALLGWLAAHTAGEGAPRIDADRDLRRLFDGAGG